MKTLFKKSMSARELPSEWREEGRFEPDDPELATAVALGELMDIIGRRAQARGLTEEKLETILHEG